MKTESTILVVDDNEDQQFIYKKYFEKTPYNLITVGNGNAGLKILQQNKIDLIILDYMMPGMNGYEFMSTLASHPIKQKAPY